MRSDHVTKDAAVYTKDKIRGISVYGGSSNISFLPSTVREYFGYHKRYHGVNRPESTVVSNAAKLDHWHQDKKHFGANVRCLRKSQGSRALRLRRESCSNTRIRPLTWISSRMFTFSIVINNQDLVAVRVSGEDGSPTERIRILVKSNSPALLRLPGGRSTNSWETRQSLVWQVYQFECQGRSH